MFRGSRGAWFQLGEWPGMDLRSNEQRMPCMLDRRLGLTAGGTFRPVPDFLEWTLRDSHDSYSNFHGFGKSTRRQAAPMLTSSTGLSRRGSRVRVPSTPPVHKGLLLSKWQQTLILFQTLELKLGWRVSRPPNAAVSLWVNGNWRLTFTFDNGDAVLVDYQDYH
jgi:hypothetical protein